MSGENRLISTAELIRILEGTDSDDENGEKSKQTVGEDKKMVRDQPREKKFSVVKFIELPSEDTEEYVTVPNNWIQRDGNTRKVSVTYPLEDSFYRLTAIRKRWKRSELKYYIAIIEHEADNFKDAEKWRIKNIGSQPVRTMGRKLRSASKFRASHSKPDSSQDGRQSTLELKEQAFDEHLRAITANQSSQPITGPRSCQDLNVKNTIKPDGSSIISNVLLSDHKDIDLAAKSLNNMAVPTRNMHRLSISSSHHSPKVQLTSTTGRGKINQNTVATKGLDDQSTHTQTTNRMRLIGDKARSPAAKYSSKIVSSVGATNEHKEKTLLPYNGATSFREADSDPEIVLNHEQLTDETAKPKFVNVPSSYMNMRIFLLIMKTMYESLNIKMYKTTKTAKGYVEFVEKFNLKAKSANALSDHGTPGSKEQMPHRVESTQQTIDEFAENYTQISTNIKRTVNNWNNLKCDGLVIGDKLKKIMNTVETFNRSADLASVSSIKKQMLNEVAVFLTTSWQRSLDMLKEINSNHRAIEKLMSTYPRLEMSPYLRIAASPSSHVTSECTQVVENNHTVVMDRDNFSNDDQHMNSVANVASTKKRLSLPPEYDPHNSRWTLKYQEYMPELVELTPGSGVFVRNDELEHYKRASSDCVSLAQSLLEGVFSESALSVCLSLFESNSDDDGCQVKPSLDDNAYIALLNYVMEHGATRGWNKDHQAILDGMQCKVQEYRRCSHSIVNVASTRKRLILPPEYDPDNPRWTLKYQANMSGLVELVCGSRVFVKYDSLKRCEKASSDCVSLAQSLLKEVFSESALSVCLSLFESESDDDGCQVKPSLDERACMVVLHYAKKHGEKCHWDYDAQAIADGMRIKVQEYRRCSHSIVNPRLEMSPYLRIASFPSSHVTSECTQVVENNHTVVMDRDNFSNDDQHMNSVANVASTKKRLSLPPEYDPHNSRWTLKYQEYMPELVELTPGSGAFVRNDELEHYKRASSDCVSLAQSLLKEVFSESALSVCLSFCESNSDDDGCQVKPSLDDNAYIALLNYVMEHGATRGWNKDHQAILDGMQSKVQEYRRCRHNQPQPTTEDCFSDATTSCSRERR